MQALMTDCSHRSARLPKERVPSNRPAHRDRHLPSRRLTIYPVTAKMAAPVANEICSDKGLPLRAGVPTGPQPCRRWLKLGIETRYILPSEPAGRWPLRNHPLLPAEQRAHLLLVSVLAAGPIGHRRADAPQQEDSLMPREIVAVTRTLCLVCVVLVAFELGEMSVSFTGTQLGWMVLSGFILVLIVLSLELLRAIWATDRT
jgi:hypothetical protein